MTIYIGIDLSTEMSNTGIAVLRTNGQNQIAQLRENYADRWCGTVGEWSRHFDLKTIKNLVTHESKAKRISAIISEITGNEEKVIIAIDVPFGWPVPFSEFISIHRIGNLINVDADYLYYRTTELEIKQNTNLNPLSVSTDKLGRTALLGSALLNELLQQNFDIQLYRSARNAKKIIEVYPTATAYALAQNPIAADFSLRKFYSDIFNPPLGPRAKIDRYDAVIASYTAYLLDALGPDGFIRGRINRDQQVRIGQEGWIWAPKRIKDNKTRNKMRKQLQRLLNSAIPR